MNDDELNLLKEIYFGFIKDNEKEKEILQGYLNRIKEIDAYLSSIKEEDDFVIFSPRSMENILSDKIKELENEKIELEKKVKEQKSKLNRLNTQTKKLRQLLINENDEFNHLEILNIQEKERQRIARELHDSSVQNLIHLGHVMELCFMFIDEDPVKAKLELENCNRVLKSIISEIRETIFNLRPMSFDDLGFKQCIENFISNCKVQYKNCEIEYDVCDLMDEYCQFKEIKKAQEANLLLVTLFRVIQEAITNALKHSNADKINLTIKAKNDKCYINIKDNGKGFSLDDVMNKKNKHFGLSIMKERISLLHGNILIDTEIGKGTEIKIDLPLLVCSQKTTAQK